MLVGQGERLVMIRQLEIQNGQDNIWKLTPDGLFDYH